MTAVASGEWRRAKLGYLVREMGGSTPSKERQDFWGGDVPWVSPKDMKVDVISNSIDHITKAALAHTSLRPVPVGSVLLVVRGMILAHSVPVALTEAPVTLNQDMKALVPGPRVSGLFLRYCLQAHRDLLLALVEEAGHGTRCLRSEQWRKFEVSLPPLPTQKAIADYLDRKTAAIDALVEKKQKLLDLLAEKRAALINQAVTKGLDPNVPMKDSGIPWIAEIPAHWEVKKLSWLLRDGPRNGVSPPVTQHGLGIRSFSLSVVRNGVIDVREGDVKYVMGSDSDVERFSVLAGDLLLVRGNGNINLVGATGLVEDDAALSGFVYPDLLMRMRCSRGVHPGFVRYCINSDVVRPQLTASARTTVGTFKVNNEQVRELRLLCPPPSEAAAISAHLDAVLGRHEATVGVLKRQLRRLQEYRQALITAAVTGQLDITSEDVRS